MDYKNIISEIVGDKFTDTWATLSPKVYYKDNKPYGLIGKRLGVDNVLYLATTCVDVNYNFTIGMIRDIVRYYKRQQICLISDTKHRHNIIIKALDSKYRFTHKIIKGTLFSFGDNHNV